MTDYTWDDVYTNSAGEYSGVMRVDILTRHIKETLRDLCEMHHSNQAVVVANPTGMFTAIIVINNVVYIPLTKLLAIIPYPQTLIELQTVLLLADITIEDTPTPTA